MRLVTCSALVRRGKEAQEIRSDNEENRAGKGRYKRGKGKFENRGCGKKESLTTPVTKELAEQPKEKVNSQEREVSKSLGEDFIIRIPQRRSSRKQQNSNQVRGKEL